MKLSDAFCAVKPNAVAPDELSRALARLYAAGRAARPEVELDDGAFAAHLAGHISGDDVLAALSTVEGADLYLACACLSGAQAALEAFDRRYIADVPSFLRGSNAAASAVDEVKQLLRERLLMARPEQRARIADYSGRGTLGSWLRVAALRTLSNLRRSERDHEELDESGPPATLAHVDPELSLVRQRCGEAFRLALDEAFAALTPRERSLFRMHFVDGLNLDRIGLVFQVHRATAHRWLVDARERLREETLRALGERLQLPPAELQSLLAVVRSKLEISLGALMRERPHSDE